ncbi:MAG: outer membrane protein assembly factor BamA [Elusimicrobia bacterium HGW-Elusimicrobia-1]|nr:MAG: outer membrane protein assembly factor BamA [Elusimicrobia bacterium HGW-Elusimicrobia-1]
MKTKIRILPLSMYIVFAAAAVFVSASPVLAASKKENAPRIAAVVVNGLYNVRERSVIAEMKSRRGALYDPAKITADIEALAAMGHFQNVEISFDPAYNVVTVDVVEKPFVRKVEFRGNKRFSRGRLLDEITVKEKEYLDKLSVMESEAKILTLYRDEGYADCSVETITSVDDENRVTVNFLVTEGNKILISDVFIRGTKVFNEKKIISLMKTRRKKVYKQDVVENDIKEIENFYKNRGWQEIAAGRPEIVFNEARTAMTVLLIISEGVRYRVGEVTFEGYTAATQKELKKLVALKKGRFYNDEKFQETLSSVQQLYSDKGYLRALARPEFAKDKETGKMDIVFHIDEGPVFYLGYVDVTGLTYTKEKVIRREVLLKEGDVFRMGTLRRSLEKIYNLGFLEFVEPEIRPTAQDNVVDLVINVAEGKPGILTAGAGYSSVDKLVGTLQVQHINLLGRAQRLNLMWEFGERKQNYEISWTEPWLLDRPMSFGFDIFNTERAREYGAIYSAYRELRKGGALRVGPRLSDLLSLLFSYSYEEIEIFDIASSAADLGITPSKSVTSSISSQIIRDSRDNVFDASRGSRNSLSIQYAGGVMGGDVNFVKTIGATSWHFLTFWKFVLSTNLRVGWIGAFEPSTGVPIYERFYVGGAETVRGYRYRGEIGPDEGGRAMMVANIEYKFPIIQERNRTVLQGAFFYDIGGAWREFGDIDYRAGTGENDLKSGVGFGIRFTTPVFPIRLDWGYGLNQKTGVDPSQFYFTIGQIF